MKDLSSFAEKESSEKFILQNPYLLKVRMQDSDILSQKGSMVAYQGDIRFEHHSSGISKLAKKTLSSDGVSLMHARGSGDLFLAVEGLRVQIVHLDDEEIYVEPSRLLALDEGIDWDLKVKAKSASFYSGGLWHLKLSGKGYVALLSDGEPMLLDCSEGAAVDRGALIAWSANLDSTIKRDTSVKTWTGRSSGESIQLHFAGSGWILLQPSERNGGANPSGGNGGFGSFLDILPF